MNPKFGDLSMFPFVHEVWYQMSWHDWYYSLSHEYEECPRFCLLKGLRPLCTQSEKMTRIHQHDHYVPLCLKIMEVEFNIMRAEFTEGVEEDPMWWQLCSLAHEENGTRHCCQDSQVPLDTERLRSSISHLTSSMKCILFFMRNRRVSKVYSMLYLPSKNSSPGLDEGG